MTEKGKPTPGPWKYDGICYIFGPEMEMVALVEVLLHVRPSFRSGLCWCIEARDVKTHGHEKACLDAQSVYRKAEGQ